MTDQEAKARRQRRDDAKAPKPKIKHKPRPKRAGAKPDAGRVDESPKVSPIGVRDPWATEPAKTPSSERQEALGAKEKEEGSEAVEKVSTGLSIADYAHSSADVIVSGNPEATSFAGLAEELAEDAEKTFNGTATVPGQIMAGSSEVFGPLAIAGGVLEMIEGHEEMKHDQGGGAVTMTGGGLGIGSGLATMLAPFGVAGSAMAAPLLGAAATGMKVGHYGNNEVKDLGWLHGDNGEAETASSWAAEQGLHTKERVTELTGSETLGSIAGGIETLEDVPDAAAVATAGAIAGAGSKLNSAGSHVGKSLAHLHRATEYASSTDGIGVRDPKTGAIKIGQAGTVEGMQGAQQMADYDDNLAEAVERAKLLHPEQWGERENEVSMFNKVAEQMQKGTRK